VKKENPSMSVRSEAVKHTAVVVANSRCILPGDEYHLLDLQITSDGWRDYVLLRMCRDNRHKDTKRLAWHLRWSGQLLEQNDDLRDLEEWDRLGRIRAWVTASLMMDDIGIVMSCTETRVTAGSTRITDRRTVPVDPEAIRRMMRESW
jgi:hypothetical protein